MVVDIRFRSVRYKLSWFGSAANSIIRLLSLELGRPSMIDDDDCNLILPSPSDEPSFGPGDVRRSNVPLSGSTASSILRVAQCVSGLQQALKAPVIEASTLQTLDETFNNCFSTFPPHLQIQSNEILDPRTLCAVIHLQNARIILHRHNLSPLGPSEVRSAALRNCFVAATDTAGIVSRIMQATPEPPADPISEAERWQAKLIAAGSTVLCTHLWRCILFLCFQSNYQAALICARASAVIGDTRLINIACSRHTRFFLQLLLNKLQVQDTQSLEHDEDMVAYVSGDLQGSDYSWIWHEDGNRSPLDTRDFSSTKGSLQTTIKEDDGRVKGWEDILATLQRLAFEQNRQQTVQGFAKPTPSGTHLAPSGEAHPRQLVSPGGSSRISIANII